MIDERKRGDAGGRHRTADRRIGDFGSKLREARERKGVSLREIANATKISVRALEALERNDISHLPGGIFSRCSYAPMRRKPDSIPMRQSTTLCDSSRTIR